MAAALVSPEAPDAIDHNSMKTSDGMRLSFTKRAIASSMDALSLTVAWPARKRRLSAISLCGSNSLPSVPETEMNTSTNALSTSS